MMSKCTAEGSHQNRLFKLKIYQGKGDDKLGIIIIKIDTKTDIDHAVLIAMVECHIELEFSMDKIIDKGHSVIKIIQMISEEEILKEQKIQGSKF